jgi:sulfatase maturation enzyme AslB (radical SAM superfamily)
VSDTYCALAWNHLNLHPLGEATICCISDMRNSLSNAKNGEEVLNIKHQSLNEIINSESFKKIRLQMVNNEKPKACNTCYWQEESGNHSRRQKINELYQFNHQEAESLTLVDGTITPNIQNLELRLGNKCNLKCSTCNPVSSSLWKEEYKEISKLENIEIDVDYNGINDEMFDWAEDKEFWKQLDSQLSNIKEININGGEPTLIEEHYNFIQTLIDKDKAKNILLEYNLNMTFIPAKLEEMWKHFKKVRIKASIDDIDKRNNFIRYPSRWDKILKNLKKLEKLNVEVVILQTVSIYNFLNLEELSLYVRKNFKNIEVEFNYLVEPYFLSPFSIPAKIRKEKIKELFLSLYMVDYNRLSKLYYNDKYKESDLKIFKSYNSVLLKNRRNSFEIDFPKLNSLISN